MGLVLIIATASSTALLAHALLRFFIACLSKRLGLVIHNFVKIVELLGFSFRTIIFCPETVLYY